MNKAEVSDGYHTFTELYHHRAVLFSVICNQNPDKAWKSRLHSDGEMFDDMFIVGIDTPDGPATYHYYLNPYWAMFRVDEVPTAPEWDGHTAEQAIERISTLALDIRPSWATHPTIPELKLDEILARCEAATKGPWTVRLWCLLNSEGKRMLTSYSDDAMFDRTEDVEFCAHARQDVPDLVAEVERLTALATGRKNEWEKLLEDSVNRIDNDIERLAAERDTWKHRAEALERALREHHGTCGTCKYLSLEDNEPPCGACYTEPTFMSWQFDEPRFAPSNKD